MEGGVVHGNVGGVSMMPVMPVHAGPDGEHPSHGQRRRFPRNPKLPNPLECLPLQEAAKRVSTYLKKSK